MGARVRRLVRAPLVVILILGGVLAALVLLHPRPGQTPPTGPKVVWCRLLLRILGVRLTVTGRPLGGPALLVANHVSWLDILVIAAACPTHFLSKAEVARWPVVGWLARRAGTVFIHRGGDNAAAEAARELLWRLRRGGRVLVFPEGTSTDGSRVRRFFPRLFQAPILARCSVQAVSLRYPAGEGLSRVVPFVGDDEFLSHLWRLLGERRIEVELHFAPPLAAAGLSRRELARITHGQISHALGLEESPALRAIS